MSTSTVIGTAVLCFAVALSALATACVVGTPPAPSTGSSPAPAASNRSATTMPVTPAAVAASVASTVPATPTIPVEAQPQRQTSQTPDCVGADGIEEIRAEYAANHIRAKETYVGQRICLRGAISDFYENGRNTSVEVTVGEEVDFLLEFFNRRSNVETYGEEEEEANWREWIMVSSVGDLVEADCWIEALTSTEETSERTPGIPMLTDCWQVVPMPCVATELGEPDYQWLEIDCPAGRVVLGRGNYRNESEEFQLVSEGDSTAIAFHFHSDWDQSEDLYEHHAPWRRWVEEPQGGRGAKEMWEAPSDVAAALISEWQLGRAEQIVLVVGECCDVDMFFDVLRR